MLIKADFHIHSIVSPCAELEMSPRNIARRAVEAGLNMIALTDHNSAMNCAAMERAARKEGLFFLPGIEVNTRDEFHVLCLFDEVAKAEAMGEEVYRSLPDIRNMNTVFGEQAYVNENDEILGFVDKYLGSATGLGLEDIADAVSKLGGAVIPAHVDREIFSITSQLGSIPVGNFAAIEVYRSAAARIELGDIPYAVISDSDSHRLADIGKVYNEFEMLSFSWDNLMDVFRNGRSKIVVNR
jgi:predicted metal-dependent phosphoesterase TrpH